MAITRTAFTEDDGTGTTGTVWGNAEKTTLYDQIDAALSAVAIGLAWTTPTFDAADFSGNGSMTWVLAAGDVTTYAYIVFGKTMILAIGLNTTTVGGTPNTALSIKVPGGATILKTMMGVYRYSDNGTPGIGWANIVATGTLIYLYKTDNTVAWSAATNTTSVCGTFTFEIE